MSSWKQQTLIEAPVGDVWQLVGDPRSYPKWAENVLELTGLAEVVEGARFEQLGKGPLGKSRTEFEVEQLHELREIKLRCQQSGLYSHWVLTEAGGDTFCEVEVGMDPKAAPYRVMDRLIGKRWYRGLTTDLLDSVRTWVR
jgi:uncharacterized protein YndB with AHSA1/START domain